MQDGVYALHCLYFKDRFIIFADIEKIRVVNSWRTQRTLNPFFLLFQLLGFTLLLLKFILYALLESYCTDDQ